MTSEYTRIPPCILVLAQVVIDVEPLGVRMADIDGTVTVTQRRLPGGGSSLSPAGRAGAALVESGEPFEAVQSLYFRSGETGVRWIPHVAASDLLSVAR